MHIGKTIRWTLALLIGLPALAFVTLALAMPLVFRLTARPVHADAASVPAELAPTPRPRWAFATAEAARLARTKVADDWMPGLSIALGIDGELVFAGAFGWADVDARVPATLTTRYRIGSVSVPLTAAAAGLLVRQGKLDLDRPVQAYLPDFPEHAEPLTTRQAMAHTAGFGHPHIEGSCPRGHGTIADGLALFADARLRFAPGSDHRYSSHGWILVSAVVEAAAGQPFDRFMREAVFAPIGMQATALELAEESHSSSATLYHPRASADLKTGLEHPDPTFYRCYAGAGGFLSTPVDLVRFALAMEDASLLGPEISEMLETPVTLQSGKSTAYGLGWAVKDIAFGAGSTRLIGHPGYTIGGTSSLRRYPQLGIVVAVSTNVSFAELAPLADQVAALFHAARGLPASTR